MKITIQELIDIWNNAPDHHDISYYIKDKRYFDNPFFQISSFIPQMMPSLNTVFIDGVPSSIKELDENAILEINEKSIIGITLSAIYVRTI